MNPEDLENLHASVFRQTGEDPKWLGYWIDRFVRSENLSRDELAEQLGIRADALVLLCLCRTPRVDHFQEDINVVCERTGARDEAVARILRQEQALTKWREGRSATTAGWLLAASDRDDDSPASGPSEEPDDGQGEER